MNNKYYLKLIFDHISFSMEKIAIVSVGFSEDKKIADYVKEAKQKVCNKLNLKEIEVFIHSYEFIGDELIFID